MLVINYFEILKNLKKKKLLIITSLGSHFVPLQATPAGLLGRFAPSGFAFHARTRFAPRVPRSVHAKFHADRPKTVGTRGIHTQTDSPSFIRYTIKGPVKQT